MGFAGGKSKMRGARGQADNFRKTADPPAGRRSPPLTPICLFRPRAVGYAGFVNFTWVADEQTGTH
jgi:hypothetical protein